LIRRGIKERSVRFPLETVADNVAFAIDSERCAIGAFGRRDPSNLIPVLREGWGCQAHGEDHAEGFQYEANS
jgi:hypothetical protein